MRKAYLFGLSLWVCTSAVATPIIFSERSEFEAAALDLSLQGFEEPFDTAASVSFPGFSVTEDSSFANVSSRTDYVSVGERSLGFTWNGDRTLTFTFDSPTDAFAADILDFGTCCGATILTITSDTGELNTTAATGVDRPRGNLQFFGVISPTPFSQLIFTSDQNSDNDLIIFDEVAFHSVPEPAGINCIALATACLLTIRRRSLRPAEIKIARQRPAAK